MHRTLAVALLALASLRGGPCGAGELFVDYLSMEPNEGGASAGHVALALFFVNVRKGSFDWVARRDSPDAPPWPESPPPSPR